MAEVELAFGVMDSRDWNLVRMDSILCCSLPQDMGSVLLWIKMAFLHREGSYRSLQNNICPELCVWKIPNKGSDWPNFGPLPSLNQLLWPKKWCPTTDPTSRLQTTNHKKGAYSIDRATGRITLSQDDFSFVTTRTEIKKIRKTTDNLIIPKLTVLNENSILVCLFAYTV